MRGIALVALLSVAAVACGDDDSLNAGGEGGDARETADEVDPQGVARVGIALDFGIHIDPTKSMVIVDAIWMQLVYGTLLRHTSEGTIEPMMAESYEVVDPHTVTLTLRDGVTFTDGTKYDAEAVRAGLLRTLNESTAANRPTPIFKEIADVVVDGPLQLTVKLTSPVGGEFVGTLSEGEGVIVSPAQVASAPDDIDIKPIGAGPYTVTDFRPGEAISLRKNPDFFDADSWRLGGIDFVSTPDGAAKVNGLLSGNLDFALEIPDADAAAVEGDNGYSVFSGFTERSYVVMLLCTGKPPFDNESVRRALQVAVDRDQVNEVVYGGHAKPALGLWPEGHPYFNPALEEVVKHAPEEARELLAEAGPAEVSFDLYYLGAAPGHGRVAEVIQAQVADVGMTANIVAARDVSTEFIQPQKPGALLLPGSRTGTDKYRRLFEAEAGMALCGQARPEILDTLAPASALAPGSPGAAALFQQADLMVAERAYLIPIVHNPIIDAWSTERVGGEPQFTATNADMMFDSFYIKK